MLEVAVAAVLDSSTLTVDVGSAAGEDFGLEVPRRGGRGLAPVGDIPELYRFRFVSLGS